MRGSHRFIPPLFGLVLIMAAVTAPITSAQMFAEDYCPAGDQAHGPPDPPGDDASRAHIDLKPGNVDLGFPSTGQVVEKHGDHLVARGGGQGELQLEVKNIGEQDASATKLRLELKTGGSTTTKTLDVPPINAGASTTVTTSMQFSTGRHVLTLDVNPDRDPDESCEDDRPNGACASVADGCTYTYYGNNQRKLGIITGGLPVLRVDELLATSPERATHGPSTQSETQITLRIVNTGSTAAYNLDSVDDPPPFVARLSIPGCTCGTQELNLTRIPPGGQQIASTTMPLHGMTGEFTVNVQIDPYQETADLEREHVHAEDTFELPTPNLQVHVTTDHETEGKDLLVPEGHPLSFDLHIKNHGDAPARTTQGGGVRVLIERDEPGQVVMDTRIDVPAQDTVVLPVTDDPGNLSDEQVYRIRVDPDDEVLEPSKGGNERYVVAHLARYKTGLRIDHEDDEIGVPPGVDGLIPFTLENEGTISDTLLLETPDGAPAHYEDMNGTRIEQVRLGPGDQVRLQYAQAIPLGAEKGDRIDARVQARSQGADHVLGENRTFVVGEDTVAPNIRLKEPSEGFLSNERIVLEVTDNVDVDTVETDLYGSFQRAEADDTNSNHYTLDATGTPNRFTLTIRAKDPSGNEATKEITIVRDRDAPKIEVTRFTPETGVRPGDKVNLLIGATDTHMGRIEIQITQPRPNGTYSENITLDGEGPRYILRDWTVPERPGYYVFNVTAIDKAGNRAHQEERLYVRGLNIEILTVQPNVVPAEPREGDRLRFTYQIRNTSPDYETGEFFVTFNVDFRRQIGLERVNLQPGEVRPLVFHWNAEPGAHAFTLVVDQAEEVAEDTAEDEDNLHFTETGVLFKDPRTDLVHPLFAPETVRVGDWQSFGGLVGQYWFLPVLLAITLGLFSAAFVLARRGEKRHG